ncbi:MAG: LLM class flavin-dependent oxidoreductase [Thermomicrobiales bacterium]
MDTTAPAPKIGLYVSSIVGGMRDGALGWRDLSAMARRAEDVGFDSFWLPDHLLFRFAGEPAHGPWECWSLLCGLAAVTSTIQLGSLVACTGYRNPALLAKMADTLDEISDGRLVLGLGAGWHEPEYLAYGYPFDHRFERFEEAVQMIRALLRDGRLDFQGTYHTANDCELRPRGPRPQGPPIMIGTLAGRPRMAQLIARHADQWNGWLVHARSYADQIPALRETTDAACLAVGRDPATLERTVGIAIDQQPADESGLRYPDATPLTPGARQPLTGSPETIAAELRRFAAEGITHIQVAPVLDGLAGIEAMAPVITLLRA